MRNSPIITVLVVLFTLTLVQACCDRKGDFGCCGKGPCNIFCCNCDDGCDVQCEKTHCDSVEWLKCAHAVAQCAAKPPAAGASIVGCIESISMGCGHCYSDPGSGEAECFKCPGKGFDKRDFRPPNGLPCCGGAVENPNPAPPSPAPPKPAPPPPPPPPPPKGPSLPGNPDTSKPPPEGHFPGCFTTSSGTGAFGDPTQIRSDCNSKFDICNGKPNVNKGDCEQKKTDCLAKVDNGDCNPDLAQLVFGEAGVPELTPVLVPLRARGRHSRPQLNGRSLVDANPLRTIEKRQNRDNFFQHIAGDDEKISHEEFVNWREKMVNSAGKPPHWAGVPVKDLFSQFDLDGNGHIDRSEFDCPK